MLQQLKILYMNNLTTICDSVGSTTTCITDYSEGFMTSGDLIIALFLFIIIVILVLQGLKNEIDRTRTNRIYLGNNSKEGKEIYET